MPAHPGPGDTVSWLRSLAPSATTQPVLPLNVHGDPRMTVRAGYALLERMKRHNQEARRLLAMVEAAQAEAADREARR